MQLIKIENDAAALAREASEYIAALETEAKKIKKKQDDMKKAILEEMERLGVIKLENDVILISYIQPTDRETLDGKTLKAECPDIYDAYAKISPVKASVRIKVK